MTRSVMVLGLAVTLLICGLSCKDEVSNPDTGSPSNIVFPPTNVSYSQHVQPLFFQACALSGCHNDAQSERVQLTSHGKVYFANPPIIVPGVPDQSVLVWRIEGTVGQRMPLNRNPLNQNQINGIRTWIAEDARDN